MTAGVATCRTPADRRDGWPEVQNQDMTNKTGNVFGLIERESGTGHFTGKIVGFPHVEFTASSLAEVETKLRTAVQGYLASNVLVLETQFAALVQLSDSAGCAESAHTLESGSRSRLDDPSPASSEDEARQIADLDARLVPMLRAFRPDLHGEEYVHAASSITGKIETFGPVGPPYKVGRPLRQLDNGDWLFEVTMIETGEREEYRLGRIVDDPDVG